MHINLASHAQFTTFTVKHWEALRDTENTVLQDARVNEHSAELHCENRLDTKLTTAYDRCTKLS